MLSGAHLVIGINVQLDLYIDAVYEDKGERVHTELKRLPVPPSLSGSTTRLKHTVIAESK